MFYFISETCLYMFKSFSRVNAYNCNNFMSGCPSSVYFSSEIFKCKFCLINVHYLKDLKLSLTLFFYVYIITFAVYWYRYTFQVNQTIFYIRPKALTSGMFSSGWNLKMQSNEYRLHFRFPKLCLTYVRLYVQV